MHIVGVLGRDWNLLSAVSRFRDPQGRFHLHPLREGPVEAILTGLVPLEMAGLLLFDAEFEQGAGPHLQRRSLDAQEVGSVDTVTVAGGSLIGEFNAGRAVGALLGSAGWDGRGARAVLLGSGKRVGAMARELASMGLAQIVILGENRPAAEQTLPKLAASTKVMTGAMRDPVSENHLAEADLVIRADPEAKIPNGILGPHLCLLDLDSSPVTPLQQRALDVGALTFNGLDYLAHRLALGLENVLGTPVPADPLLALLHDTPG